MTKPSELFEGENSSLRKTYDAAVATPGESGWREDYENERDRFTVYDKSLHTYVLNDERLQIFIDEQIAIAIAATEARVREALTKEWYGISYESDKCPECSNHDRIKEALALFSSKTP